MLLRFMALLGLLYATPAAPSELAGTWEFDVAGTALFRIEVQHTASGWAGSWARPTDFNTDGDSFFDVTGPTIHRIARNVREVDGDLELTFDDPRPHSMPDVLRLHLRSPNDVQMTYAGTGFDAFTLFRLSSAAPLGPWDAERIYSPVIERPTNPEMRAIFEADQNDRFAANIDWKAVDQSDKLRRARTQQLIDSNALNSGTDFLHAAFIFQHGDTADDYLKAHVLAMVAVARGRPDAIWIASATLDRYLINSGHSQVLGTQFDVNDGKATQEPYNRALIPDALRKALHVPSLADQEIQRRGFEEKVKSATTTATAPQPK